MDQSCYIKKRIGLFLKHIVCVVNTSLSFASFRERQITELHKDVVPSEFPVSKTLPKTELKIKSPRKQKLTELSKVACEPAPSKLIRTVGYDHAYPSRVNVC